MIISASDVPRRIKRLFATGWSCASWFTFSGWAATLRKENDTYLNGLVDIAHDILTSAVRRRSELTVVGTRKCAASGKRSVHVLS